MKLKLPKIPNIIWAILIPLLVIGIFVFVFVALPGPDPLDQYIVSRQCDFIQYGALSAASCSDGTNWTVSELQP